MREFGCKYSDAIFGYCILERTVEGLCEAAGIDRRYADFIKEGQRMDARSAPSART